MKCLKKHGFYFLLLAVLSDFLTPYILGIFYPELNQMTRVMSVFGDVASPVRGAFLVWSVVSGMFFVLALPAIYQSVIKTSRTLAILLASAIGLFVIGGSLGLSEAVLKRSNERISFGRLTLPHQLMRLVLVEQVYRAFRIVRGEPYHK
ncbi:hypothetical protein E1I06_08980 [Listeria monocytogenes]|uniref:23S rRNA (pseudouridine(1915)-N(3))-methyltransferase RlmH n=1 Tax=Listeria monocytogenes TaxID=1639 RepID=UPI000E718B48|nr:23S rRNA (pseudouridine(1915)-N(3))-methyltransferase RlmH [Listeria monocytogenes]EAE2451626.1 hypothetical protein [Listeria monocytogenes]EAF2233848.1 hypothetical protein [Listeria monocytogenes]EAG3579809.1 hypothetical protein [Listeria monocytogenes]EAW7172413.1 23S rRNA (pseudouridine(1915)-N(3))-methyltransferase RlmH [Listeria monocytogenes]EAW7207809.1 23S rRNA (pseudouridine(1915)-N(3))-methyltransferase RlmH [Listeria monocytogenes]